MTDLSVRDDVSGGLDDKVVRGLLAAVLASEGTGPSSVSVAFADARTIRDLNRRHRGKDRPTDVLSYPFDASFPQGSGGEVIVCPEVVRRQAGQDGRSPERALREAVVHGLLHVFGHEDDTERGAREMDRRTRRILEADDG